MSENHPIIIEGLTKAYRNRLRRSEVHALLGVSLTVGQGQVVALVGPNGAGKTTTIHALLGMVRPDTGTVSVFGQPGGSLAARRRMGFQSEIFHTYGYMTAEEILRFYGYLAEMPSSKIAEAVPRQLERLGLSAVVRRKVNGFSKGMTQRLGLAQALLHQPELLILDEPTTGLDPEGRKLVADIILEEKQRGATVFLSTHILSDIERLCDHVIIIRKGQVVYSENMAIVRGAASEWEIEVMHVPAGVQASLQGIKLRETLQGGFWVSCRAEEKDRLLAQLIAAGASVGAVRQKQSLEDIYMQYAGGTSHG